MLVSRLSTVRRRVLVGVVLVGLMAATSACDAGRPAAARVNGRTVPTGLIDDFVKDLSKTSAGAKTALAGQSTGTWNAAQVSNLLGFLVEENLIIDAAHKSHVVVSAADRSGAKKSAESVFASSTSSTDDGSATFAKFSKPLQALLIEAAENQSALQEKLGKGIDRTAEAEAAFDANRSSYVDVCISTITVQTEAQVTAAQAELKAGKSFASVAKSSSLDDFASQGGANPCAPLSEFGSVASDLASGAPTDIKGPYTTQSGGIVLVSVTSRKPETFAQAKSAVLASLPAAGQAQFAAYMDKFIKHASVSVDPRYGTWSTASGTVKPPHDPLAAPTTTAPASTSGG